MAVESPTPCQADRVPTRSAVDGAVVVGVVTPAADCRAAAHPTWAGVPIQSRLSKSLRVPRRKAQRQAQDPGRRRGQDRDQRRGLRQATVVELAAVVPRIVAVEAAEDEAAADATEAKTPLNDKRLATLAYVQD